MGIISLFFSSPGHQPAFYTCCDFCLQPLKNWKWGGSHIWELGPSTLGLGTIPLLLLLSLDARPKGLSMVCLPLVHLGRCTCCESRAPPLIWIMGRRKKGGQELKPACLKSHPVSKVLYPMTSWGHVALLLNDLHVNTSSRALKVPSVLGEWSAGNEKGGKALGPGAMDLLSVG